VTAQQHRDCHRDSAQLGSESVRASESPARAARVRGSGPASVATRTTGDLAATATLAKRHHPAAHAILAWWPGPHTAVALYEGVGLSS
jgi:hypothetical protein